jgi:hypothetical protein
MRQECPDLRRHYWRAIWLWSGSYFAGSVGGATISALRQYTEQQNRPVRARSGLAAPPVSAFTAGLKAGALADGLVAEHLRQRAIAGESPRRVVRRAPLVPRMTPRAEQSTFAPRRAPRRDRVTAADEAAESSVRPVRLVRAGKAPHEGGRWFVWFAIGC